MTSGICRLCGQDTMLSYEHVPPRITFNKNTRYKEVPFDEYVKVENPLKDLPKGRTKQGGIGYNSFCQDCNSFLGSNYVPAYKKWALGGMEILKNSEFELHNYIIKEIEPRKILKHIISMFLAINKEWYLESYPELSEFVSKPESNHLPDKFKVFSYLTRAERTRYMHHVVQGNFKTGISINCSEIAFPPYGYVLTVGHNAKIQYLTDITEFKDIPDSKDLNLNIFQLPTYMPFPLDYRTKDKLEIDIAQGIEATKKHGKNSS